ncbi:MAG TPA: DnaJ C-terminal domain-containing protein [Gammaproteobacteria bacterium]|jgi:curved DNA-binding protein|nr:DnaJ C-terminal domain-containing protein [Gammaproteobacteria bacterium]
MEYKDYYKILGVERGADADAIKHAYRRMARKYHPDVSKEKNAEEQFKNVQEAYEVLKDPEKRSAYDALGSNWKAGQEFRPPPGWDADKRFHQAGGRQFSEEDLHDFSDFFSNIFGGGGGAHAGFGRRSAHEFRQRGNDQHAKILVTLDEAFAGGERTIQLQVPEIDAEGRIQQKVRTLKVIIPSGAVQGQQLRLAGQGGPGIGGGPNGDLYLEIDIQNHPLFTLQGRDIYMTLPVTPWEAALGAEIKIPTLGGPVGLKLTPDSQSGQKLRLKGRGMPGKPAAGDQYAVLQIQTPSPHNDEQKRIYQDMAAAMPFNPRKDWVV